MYERLTSAETSTSTDGPTATTHPEFIASKGRFNRFKRQFSLHNLKIIGESGSVDHVLVAAIPATLDKIIQEKGYKPEQVWNMDETGL